MTKKEETTRQVEEAQEGKGAAKGVGPTPVKHVGNLGKNDSIQKD